MALPAGRVHWGVTVATSVQKHHANRTSVGPVPPLNAAAHDPHDGKGGLLQSWAGGPRPEWTVPVYLASPEPAQFRVGITFLRRTFFACVLCFGLTIYMTACLLVLWGKGLEEEVYEDICYQQTRWNCFQWATDGSLLLVITPLTLSRGMYYGWTRLILALLAITMSAKLALIGCYSRSIAPIAFQTFFTFWVALTVMWLVCWRRERQLLRIQSSNTTALIKQQAVLGRVSSSHVACSGCVGMDGSRSGWKTWLCLALCGTLSVTFCNFLLMLFKLWLDEPSTFERFADGSGSGANSYNRHKALPLDPDTGDDAVFSREGDLRLVELLMGGPGLALSAKLGKVCCEILRTV